MLSILFLDEEHAVRSVFSEVLRNEGHVVLEAADMSQAAQACKEYGAPIDLAILCAEDGIVAEAKRLAEAWHDMRVLFIGKPEWKLRLRRPQAIKSAWLEKPFTSAALLQAVRKLAGSEVLHARS